MLPPDPPPPDLPDPVTSGHAREPGRQEKERTDEEDAGHDAVRLPQAYPRGRPRLALARLLLLALSTVGVGVAFVLLASGHPTLAGRVLAGDVLLIFGILIIV